MFLALKLVLSLTNNQRTNGFIAPFVEMRLIQSSRIYFWIWTIYLVSEPWIIFTTIQPFRHKAFIHCVAVTLRENTTVTSQRLWRKQSVFDNDDQVGCWHSRFKGVTVVDIDITHICHATCATWNEQISNVSFPRCNWTGLTARCVWVKQSAGKLLWCRHATCDAIVKRQGPFH